MDYAKLIKFCEDYKSGLQKSTGSEAVEDKIFKLKSGRDSIMPKKSEISLPKLKLMLPKLKSPKMAGITPPQNKVVGSEV